VTPPDESGRATSSEKGTVPREWVRDLLQLKRTTRAGWLRVGVERPESVADHSFAMALLAWRIARDVPGLDASHVVLLALLHDFHEARLGDIPTPTKTHFPEGAIEEAERSIATEQWPPGDAAAELLEEFTNGDSPEAELARAIDHLEFLLQASAYLEAGNPQVERMLQRAKNGAAWRHPVTRPWAEEILRGPPAAR
jgi:putative hydrolase of HD superfamily